MSNEITAYKTSDGQLFESEAKAEEHQFDIVGELLDKLIPHDTRGNITHSDRHCVLIQMLASTDLADTVNELHQALSMTDIARLNRVAVQNHSYITNKGQ